MGCLGQFDNLLRFLQHKFRLHSIYSILVIVCLLQDFLAEPGLLSTVIDRDLLAKDRYLK